MHDCRDLDRERRPVCLSDYRPAAAPGACALLAVALMGSGPGCTGTEAPPGEPIVDTTEGELVVGGAARDGTGFVEMEDGTAVELIPGAQGGFHVWLNVQVRGIAGALYIERSARRVRGDTLVFRGLPQRFEVPDQALDAWWHSPLAAPAFMCPSPVGIRVFDEELVFSVQIMTDYQDGELLAMDRITLLTRCPDGEQGPICQALCAG